MNHTMSAHAGFVPGEEHTLSLWTERGEVLCRYHPVPGARHAVVMVGGVGGGWDTPAHDLYPRLCSELPREGLACLRVQFREPSVLREAVWDVLAGLRFLEEQGLFRATLVGHSLGAAVIIQAAESSPEVRAVICLAPQSAGANAVNELGPECATYILHGIEDAVLPFYCAQAIYEMAREPRKLVLIPDCGHTMGEAADVVHHLVVDWIRDVVRRDAPPPPPPQVELSP